MVGSIASGSINVSRNSGRVISFFEPCGNGLSGDAESARQPTQAAAFVVSAKDALTFSFGVAVGLWVVTALASAASTEVALFAILRQAITRKLIAAAVIAF